MAEVRPVDLALVSRQGARAQIGLGFAARAQLRDAVAEVIGPDVTGHWNLTHTGQNSRPTLVSLRAPPRGARC